MGLAWEFDAWRLRLGASHSWDWGPCSLRRTQVSVVGWSFEWNVGCANPA